MVRHCIAVGCVNRSNKVECKGLSWHSLPLNDSKRLKKWLINIRRTNTPKTKSSFLCSDHFAPECFQKSPGGVRGRLKVDAVPTLFSFTKVQTQRKAPQHRSNMATQRQETAGLNSDESIANAVPLTESNEVGQSIKEADNSQDQSLQLIINELEGKVKQLEHELKQERETRKTLEEKLNRSLFNIDNIKENDNLVRFYTGFNSYAVFTTVLNFLGREAAKQLNYTNTELVQNPPKREKQGPRRALSVENELFLLLCRYKVGLLEEDVAVRFGICQSLVSRIIITWTKFIYFRFSELDIFPTREVIEAHKPECFRNKYNGTTVIIDATELYIETPTNPEAQQLTFSTYKNGNTLKALVGITPSGSVCFVSNLYGGSISDKEITVKSKLMDKLQYGDEVMADRGFNIQELLASKGVKVNVPPYMNEAGQFTEQEMLNTRRIASLRIHVERAIERIKNYHILDFIPITVCKNGLVDMIFFNCAMFTNFLPPLVK